MSLEDGILRIAAADLLDDREIQAILETLRRNRLEVDEAVIESWDRARLTALIRQQEEISSERLVRTFAKLEREPDNALYVEQAVTDIVAEALQMRASDIHITAKDEVSTCWIAYRIDGDLSYRHLLPPTVMAPIATRIKTDSKMDAAERRRPQDGRFSYRWQGRTIDVRAATLPIMPGGEKLTLRLLDAANLVSFDDLFRSAPAIAKRLRTSLTMPTKEGGFLVVSGPTGSGKSTSLFAMTQAIDRSTLQVYEVAQPIEYEQHLVSQISITEGSSLTYSTVIKALLRHDPNALVVGEIRDADTVEAALRMVEGGCFVLSTVHAQSASNTLDRLFGLLPEGYRQSGIHILGHYLTGVINQRLVKTLCPSCKVPVQAGLVLGAHCAPLGIDPSGGTFQASPHGCELCRRSGYLGRELLLEAIFAPDSVAGRQEMTRRILTGRSTIGTIASTPGAILHSRVDSVRNLIAKGVMDGPMAARLLSDLQDTEQAGTP